MAKRVNSCSSVQQFVRLYMAVLCSIVLLVMLGQFILWMAIQKHTSTENLQLLYWLGLGTLCLLFMVLLFEGIFVIRPAVQTLKETMARAQRAEELAILEHELVEQKRELEQGIDHILQVQVRVANGDLSARAPLANDHMLWQISSGLNTLITRLQRTMQSEQELQRLQMESERIIQDLRLSSQSGSFAAIRSTDSMKTPYPPSLQKQEVVTVID